ncbi:HlyD family secretion protein [Alistipes sp. ZOR0009]|uniref:HlyD family secretion protein n=1 Tax=Alistipes sp. ZOR0009 TaxID=1339253 RepID=UPI000AE597FC|nr:HlyD family efflux transporter periplasmic adaptor subunit [Alistipes sp. ZOR0009]
MEDKEIKGTDSTEDFNREELQNIIGSIPSSILRRGITLIALIVISIIVGSAVFKYPDIISTSMTLTSMNPSIALTAKVSGRLLDVRVVDKQYVKKGEYLSIIENYATIKDVIFIKEYLDLLNQNINKFNLPPVDLNLGSMQSLYSNLYHSISEYYEFKRLRYHNQKISYINNKIHLYEDLYKNAIQQKENIYEQFNLKKNKHIRDSILNNQGVISSEELENSKYELLQNSVSISNMQSTIQNAAIQISQMKENIFETKCDNIEKNNLLLNKIKIHSAELRSEIKLWEQNYVFISPINGNVNFTNCWVKNKQVTSGDLIFNIIPDKRKSIIGESQIYLSRSGKVKIGQKVNVRFYNFPDNEYGIVRGVVNSISIVPTKNKFYIVKIIFPNGLKTSYNIDLPFLPEMRANADIIINDLSLLERILMPLKRIWTERM